MRLRFSSWQRRRSSRLRVLLDECVPRHVAAGLPDHEVTTVPRMGWAGTKNGKLLQLAIAAGFQVFITMDRGLRHQQNLGALPIAVVTLSAQSNRLAAIRPLLQALGEMLPTLEPGEIRSLRADS